MIRGGSYFCAVKFWAFLILLGSFQLLSGQVITRDGAGKGGAAVPGKGKSRSIVDDSTKQVYGPNTVQITNEYLIKNNLKRYSNPDTTVYRREKYDLVDGSDRRYQSLGFIGSPLFDFQYDLTDQIGRSMGIDGYNLYFKKVEDVKYYDTKSPFMDVGVVLGGQSRSKIDFTFTRNVNPDWNLGFDINRITNDKQIALQSQGDRQVQSSSFDIYTHYYNEEKPVEFAFSFTTLSHNVADLGGVDVPVNPTTPDFFLYQDSDTKLSDASTLDKRSRIHGFGQYRLGSGFQVYLQSDIINRTYKFSDDNSGSEFVDFFPGIYIDSTKTAEELTYREFTNEIGLKGNMGGAFYRFFLKRRALIYDQKYALEESIGETYAGTYLRFDWKEKFSVTGLGELSNEGAYRLQGIINSDFLEASYTSQRSLPSFLVQNYTGNHHEWSNSFRPTFSNRIAGKLKLKTGSLDFTPGVSLTTRSNMIVFNEDQIPEQISNTILINRFEVGLGWSFLKGFGVLGMHKGEYFRIENLAYLQDDNGANSELINAPQVRYSGRLFWRGDWFQNAVPVEIGTDVYFRSSFYGNAYDPVIAAYHVQNELELGAYTAVDFFINMKIRNLRAYLKWVHINQQPNDGYMTTPYFPGQKGIFDLGVQWLFFD